VGLVTAGGLAEIAAGVLGTVATRVASTGSRAAGREAQTPRLVGACERQARVFLGAAALPSSFRNALKHTCIHKRACCQLPL
jgi:hypothetical protein